MAQRIGLPDHVSNFAVCSNDNIPSQFRGKLTKTAIVNIQDSDQGGSHWVLAMIFDDEFSIYFDPFGVSPRLAVQKFLKQGNRKILVSTESIQEMRATSCGYWCLYALYLITNVTGSAMSRMAKLIAELCDLDNSEKYLHQSIKMLLHS